MRGGGVKLSVFGRVLSWTSMGTIYYMLRDAQVRLLEIDLAKATRHPAVNERPLGCHRERPDVRALGKRGGT